MIFIDRSIPKSVADSLKAVRDEDDVRWLEDLYAHDKKDDEWLADAGKEGWLVLTRDKKIRTRPGERHSIIQHGVGCFIFGQKKDPTRWEYYKLLGGALDEMERLYASTPRPFIFLVARDGKLRRYNI